MVKLSLLRIQKLKISRKLNQIYMTLLLIPRNCWNRNEPLKSTNERSDLNLLYIILQNISPTSPTSSIFESALPNMYKKSSNLSDKTIDNFCFLKSIFKDWVTSKLQPLPHRTFPAIWRVFYFRNFRENSRKMG